MASTILNKREAHVAVTSAELSALLGNQAKNAGLIPADFNVTGMHVHPDADSGYTLVFVEESEV